jgi:hypothetical protein
LVSGVAFPILWVEAGGVTGYAYGSDQAGGALAGGLVALVAFDELGAGYVMDFVVLVAKVGHPAAGEDHQASSVDGFAAIIKVGELIGDVAGQSSDGVSGCAARESSESDSSRHDQRAQKSTDAEGRQS